MNIADGYAELLQAAALAMTPDPELRLDWWSEEHVVLPKGSPFAGPYRLSHTPFARRVLQCLSPGHPAARVVVMAASQMLKTQVFINAALGWVPMLVALVMLGVILNMNIEKETKKMLEEKAAKAAQVPQLEV